MIKINGKQIIFKRFNDNSLRLNYLLEDSPDVLIITWLYESDLELSELFFLTKHIKNILPYVKIILNMPYVNSGRMDRVKTTDECFTLKYFCDFINSLHFDQVQIFDPHSDVTPALLNNIKVNRPQWEISKLLSMYPNATLFFCDNGGVKRYKDVIGDVYYAFGVKEREWSTQKINSLQIIGAKHMIAGHDILIIDDIISRGSTIYLASKQLKELGAANIYIWASHCENTVLGAYINGQSLLDYPNLITKIYTSNSIYTSQHEKIEVMKVFE